jgi:glycerophosphoryl diester phosphodiesterase
VLEIKNHFDPADLEAMIKVIEELDYIDGMIYISFSWENSVDMRRFLPEATIQWLTSYEVDEAKMDEMVSYGLDLDIYYKRLDKETLDLLHSKGIKVNCWTVDNKEEAEALVDMGIDFITTNILE